MSPDIEEIKQRLRLGQDGRWGFKHINFRGDEPMSSSRNDLADEIGAFANAWGGILLCGVTDKGEVQDMSLEQMRALMHLLSEVCRDSIKPPIRPRIKIEAIEDDKAVVVVEVDESDALHESPGGYLYRSGSIKRDMSIDHQLHLARQRPRAHARWFDRQIVPETSFRSLDEALWKPLLDAQSDVYPEVALKKMGLLREEAGVTYATVAGVLLCSQAPETWLPSARIMATHYRGKDRASGHVDADEMTGPLKQQIKDAVAFAVRNMREDRPEYSEKAIFEAVVNAVVHRDYSMRGSKVFLRMFEDRLEIQSPGNLPGDLTIDNMANQQATRNETLASVLRQVPASGIRGGDGKRFIMELRGTGASIMRGETEETSGEPPEFRMIGNAGLCVCLPAADVDPISADAATTVRGGACLLPGMDISAPSALAAAPHLTHGENTCHIYGHTVPLHPST